MESSLRAAFLVCLLATAASMHIKDTQVKEQSAHDKPRTPVSQMDAESMKRQREASKTTAENVERQSRERSPAKAEDAKAEEAKATAEEARPKAEEAKPKAEEAKPKAEEA